VAGDFNIILDSKEKRGSIIMDPFREICEDIISNWDLIDVVPKKGRFTWTNKRQGREDIVARLDKFLIKSDLLLENFVFNSTIVSNGISYHKTISLEGRLAENYGPLPFRFSPLWLQDIEVKNIILRQCGNYVQVSPIYIFETKLKMVKTELKAWEKNHYQEP